MLSASREAMQFEPDDPRVAATLNHRTRMGNIIGAFVIMGLTLMPAFSLAGKGDEHSQEVIKHAKEGISHTKEAMHHLEESIKGTNDAHAKEALEHAKESIRHAEESIAHAEMGAKKSEEKKK
jgi:hypothetical protein